MRAKLMPALKAGTPNRERIALQMVKDMLDEASFEASPAHVIPDAAGRAAGRLIRRAGDGSDGRSSP